MNDTWVVVLSVISAVAVAILANGATLLLYKSQRGKNKAEAADVLTGTALRIVENMEARIREMENQMAEQEVEITDLDAQLGRLKVRVQVLEDENHDLRDGAEILIGQLVSLEQAPKWRPQIQGHAPQSP